MSAKTGTGGIRFVRQPASADRLGDHLVANFSRPWERFRAAVAFVKRTGTRHISAPLAAFSRSSQVEIIAGIDHGGTSSEGLQDLLDAVSPTGRIVVFHNRLPYTFHPKIYLFKSSDKADLVVGSGNLTEGGLFTNYEAGIHIPLDLADPAQAAVLRAIDNTLDAWAAPDNGLARVLDAGLLAVLVARGLVLPEAHAVFVGDGEREGGRDSAAIADDALFASRAESRAPPVAKRGAAPDAQAGATAASQPASGVTGFVMTLQQTDVGVGQATAGAPARSPEIFIPLAARDAQPDFWGWPTAFAEDADKKGKYDRWRVRMRLGAGVIDVNMMTWPDKHDFRLRCEVLRSAGEIGDILRLEKVGSGVDYEYYAEVVPQGTSQHALYQQSCRHRVRNSRKMYGYY